MKHNLCFYNIIKRILDLFFATIGLILFMLPLVIISVVIKTVMPGPIFFVQQRIGLYGKPFKLYKFRTMKVASGKKEGSFDAGDGSRITPFGHFLRKTKLDEIPQLLNVLLGDMSITGPRPEVQTWTKVYPDKWRIVHSIKPGITDNASILFRNEEKILARSNDPVKLYKEEILPKKLDLYIDYANRRSLYVDFKIITNTIISLFRYKEPI